MRICIITPPSCFLLDERVFMSLGILRVAAVLEMADHTVDHLDLSGVKNYEDVVRHYKGSEVFAITATTPQMPYVIRIVEILKGKGKIILGGPHPTLLNAAAKLKNERATVSLTQLLEKFDCIVAGDGEKAIFRALNEYGLIDADDTHSPLWETSKEFEDYPWPARHLVDVDSYHYMIDGERALSIITQLGCPFECGFCGGRLTSMLRRIRQRSPLNAVAEMIHLYDEYGIKGLMFLDDELNLNRRLIEMMHMIQKTGINWRFRGFVKSELFTEEQANAMYAAGFRWLLCGFESAHPRILRNINKKATLEDNTRMLNTAHKAGLKVKALMSFGHPGEDEETILTTRDWLLEQKPDDFDCTVITVYPGTPYYDRAVHVGDNIYKYEFKGDVLFAEDVDFTLEPQYYKGRPGDYKSFVWTDKITASRIAQLRDDVEHEVRTRLDIPYPAGPAAINYEHSMGAR